MSSQILLGDARETLTEVESESVHMAVTSPPYYSPKKGLRAYEWDENKTKIIVEPTKWADGWVGYLGKEPHPDMYVSHLMEIFSEVWRVLRPDATFFLNLGDSHAGSGCGPSGKTSWCGQNQSDRQGHSGGSAPIPEGLKRKDIFGIPYRVGFAMQKAGWYWRSIIPWEKKSGMPGSYKDRPISTIEHILILTKTEDNFYDYVPVMYYCSNSYKRDKRPKGVLCQRVNENTKQDQNDSQFKKMDKQNLSGNPTYMSFNERWKNRTGNSDKRLLRESDLFFESFQGLWLDENNEPEALVLNTGNYAGKHSASFPPELPEICLLMGTSEKGVCPICGSPQKRVIKTEYVHHDKWYGERADARHSRGSAGKSYDEPVDRVTIGWEPGCKCNVDFTISATVLDMFHGSGATGVACNWHNRDYIGCEINPDYVEMSKQRLKDNK